jgi:3',5'-cyclic-AMP phosphodiesterase
MPLLIAQLSDLHVLEPGTRLGGLVDTNGPAAAAVDRVNRLKVDLVLVTGDLTDAGRPAQYGQARTILDALEAPYAVIPGNHDRRADLLGAFADHCATDHRGRVAYTIEEHELRLVALDSLVDNADEGLLGDEQLDWLDRTLSAAPARPTALFLHHPPIDTGVWWMDTARLGDATAFAAVVSRHPHVVHVFAGHVHRSINAWWAGVPLSICPSTAFEVLLDLVPEAPPRAVPGAPAFHLHRFDGSRVTTHCEQIGRVGDPIDLSPFFGDWPETRATWRARAAGLQ